MYHEKYRKQTTIWGFYLSRFLRIWLPFATAFLLMMFTMWIIGQPKSADIIAGLPLLGIASHGRDILGVSWSLDIELQFYLCVPLIWIALHPDGNPLKKQRLWSVLGLTIGLSIIGWIVQLNFGLWTFLPYLVSFMAGALLWRLEPHFSGKAAVVSLIAFGIVGVLVALIPYTRPLLQREVISPFHEDWFGIAWVLLLIPFLGWNIRQKSGFLDGHMAAFSYSLYIIHWPAIALLRPFFEPLSMIDRVGILGAITVVSIVFYISVDRPWEKVRRSIIHKISRKSR